MKELEDWRAWVEASVEDEIAYLRSSFGEDVLFHIAHLGAVVSLDSYAEWQRDYRMPGLAFGIRDQIPSSAPSEVRATLMLWDASKDRFTARSMEELKNKP